MLCTYPILVVDENGKPMIVQVLDSVNPRDLYTDQQHWEEKRSNILEPILDDFTETYQDFNLEMKSTASRFDWPFDEVGLSRTELPRWEEIVLCANDYEILRIRMFDLQKSEMGLNVEFCAGNFKKSFHYPSDQYSMMIRIGSYFATQEQVLGRRLAVKKLKNQDCKPD